MLDSLFVKTFGDYPMIRVLDFLIENRIFDYSKSEIAENSGVSRTTMDAFWDSLLKKGIIKKTRVIGRAVMYKLDTKSPVTRKLIDLDFTISKQYVQRNRIPAKAHL